MIWAGHVAGIWEMDNECKILVGKPEEKRDSEDLGMMGG
jgi:hypothetical protein